MWSWRKKRRNGLGELVPLERLPVVFRGEGETFDDTKRTSRLTYDEFLDVRWDVKKASSMYGRLQPDHYQHVDRRFSEDEPCSFYLIDDCYNDIERYQRMELCHPNGVSREWFDEMRRVLDQHRPWALGLSGCGAGYALLYPDRLLVTGEGFKDCQSFDQFFDRLLAWLEVEHALKSATDEKLKRLAPYLTHKTSLSFTGTKITDEGLSHLASLHRLEWLTLDDTVVSDAGMTHLQSLVNLKSLSLSNTRVSDRGLRCFKALQ